MAVANREPNMERVKAFRPVTKPKLYESAKKQTLNLAQLQRDIRLMNGTATVHHQALQDTAPYLKFFSAGAYAASAGAFETQKPEEIHNAHDFADEDIQEFD